MRRIYWDTMLYIYWLEDHPRYAARIEHIHSTMQKRGDLLCSSSLAFAEVLVGPLSTQDLEGQQVVNDLFRSPEISIFPFPLDAAPMFATLRAIGIKPPDALHLATAAHADVDLFITNDKRLHSLSMPGLPLITTLDTDLF